MAYNDLAGNNHDRPVTGQTQKPWMPVILVLVATALLLSSAKAIGFLLPYINSRLF